MNETNPGTTTNINYTVLQLDKYRNPKAIAISPKHQNTNVPVE